MYILEVSDNPARPESDWLSGFYKSYISATMGVIILEQKPKDAHFSKLRLLKFPKQSTKPNEHEIYSNRENFQQFLRKLTFVGVLSPKLSEVEI